MGPFERLTYLVLEPNSSCNLRCASCNRQRLVEQGLRPPKNLSVGELEDILGQLSGCPIDTVKLQYLSEPMMHPQLDQLAQRIRRQWPAVHMISATNLQFDVMKSPLVATLEWLDMLYLSVDGTGKIYEQAREGARYQRLLQSLEKLKEVVPSSTRQKKLHINFTLTPANYLEVTRMYELAEKYGLASVRINLAQNWNEDELNELRFGPELIEYLKPFAKDVKGVGGWDFKDCYWPHSGTVIDVYGDVRQCVINTSADSLGNVFKTPLREIFNQSRTLQVARERLRKNLAPNGCKNCDYKYLSKTLQEIHQGQIPNPARQSEATLGV